MAIKARNYLVTSVVVCREMSTGIHGCAEGEEGQECSVKELLAPRRPRKALPMEATRRASTLTPFQIAEALVIVSMEL